MGAPGCSGITQGPIDRIFIVPMIETAVVNNVTETAQWRYDNIYKYKLCGTQQDWEAKYAANHYVEAPLCFFANNVLFKNKYHIKVHFLGLDPQTGIITPWISDQPAGYFAHKYLNPLIYEWAQGRAYPVGVMVKYGGYIYVCLSAHTSALANRPPNATYWDNPGVAEGQINEYGWETESDLLARAGGETRDLMESDYFEEHCDLALDYCKNVANVITEILVTPPPYIRPDFYRTSQSRAAAKVMSSLSIPIMPWADKAAFEFIDARCNTILHEHTHYAFDGQELKTIFGRDGIRGMMPDMYVELSAGQDAPPPPWNTYPIWYTCFQANYTYMVSPMMAWLFGFYDSIREITESGTYEIERRSDTFDHIMIRCPGEKYTYCFITYEQYPAYVDASSYSYRYKGAYAYYVRLTRDSYGGYTLSNISGMPVCAHMSDEMTEMYGYMPLNGDTYDGTRLKRRSVLLDFETYSGVSAEFEGYYVREDGTPYIKVSVVLDAPEWDVENFIVTSVATAPPYLTVYPQSGIYIANADYVSYEWSLQADMSGATDMGTIEARIHRDALWVHKEVYSMTMPRGYGGILIYARLVAHGSNGVSYSNILSLVASLPPSYQSAVSIRAAFMGAEVLYDTKISAYDKQACGIYIAITSGGVQVTSVTEPIAIRSGVYVWGVAGLIPDTQYEVSARLVWANGQGEATAASFATTDVIPGTITIEETSTGMADSIEVLHNVLDDATSYEFEINDDGVITTLDIPIEEYLGEGRVRLDYPHPGSSYAVRVRGKYGHYNSAYSDPINAHNADIEPPTITDYKYVDGEGINLSWEGPSNLLGVPTYAAQYSYDNFATIAGSVAAEDPYVTISGAQGDTDVYIRVQAIYGTYTNVDYHVVVVHTGAMTSPEITELNPGLYNVLIGHQLAEGEAYLIEVADEYEFKCPMQFHTMYEDYVNGMYEVGGLVPASLYYFRVKIDAVGYSWSTVQVAKTDRLATPVMGPLTIGDSGTLPAVLTLAMEWTQADNLPALRYDVSIYATGPGGALIYSMSNIEGLQHEVPVTAYMHTTIRCQVRATWMGTASFYSSGVNIFVAPENDKPHIYAVAPDYETARVRHHLYAAATGYTIGISNNDENYSYATVNADYDESGYYQIPGTPLSSGTGYAITVTATFGDGQELADASYFETLSLLSPVILSYTYINHDTCTYNIAPGGALEDELVEVMVSRTADFSVIDQTIILDHETASTISGLSPVTRYYLKLRTYKDYPAGRVYSHYSEEGMFDTFYSNNNNDPTRFNPPRIMDMKAELKTANLVEVTWNLDPYNVNAPFTIYRSITGYGNNELVGRGMGNAFIDDIRACKDNENIGYLVESLNSTAYVQLGRQGDGWLLNVAADYQWQLDNGSNSTKAVAYCLGKNSDNCPECFSESLGKRIKSACETCDGSGKLTSYVGPIAFKYAPLQTRKDMADMGNAEIEREIITVWTGNLPLLNLGDIVINEKHAKYIVQAIPERTIMHSSIDNAEFITRQTMALRRIDDAEYPKLDYYGKTDSPSG